MIAAPKVLRRSEWAWPTKPVHLEVVAREVPDTDKPPLLFLHGLGHAAWCYAENWQAAAAERGVFHLFGSPVRVWVGWGPDYATDWRGKGRACWSPRGVS